MHVIDWLPTIATVTGGKLPADLRIDGVDQWQTLRAGQPAPARTIYIARTPTDHALYQGDWKLIRNGKTAETELFNLATDPYEKEDRAKSELAVVAELSALLEQQQALDLANGTGAEDAKVP
jgi:arylsulfatase A-like enzyme